METAHINSSVKLYPTKIEASELYDLLSSIFLSQGVPSQTIKGKTMSFQPLKNRNNALYLQTKGIKLFSTMEYSATREIRQAKVQKLLSRSKMIQNLQIDFLPQRNIQSIYKCISKKVQALDCRKFEGLPKQQREVLTNRFKEFKYIHKLVFQGLPDYKSASDIEPRAFKNSLKSLRRLKTLSFTGETSPRAMADILSFSLTSHLCLQTLSASFVQLPMEQFERLHKALMKLSLIKRFKLQIPEAFINDETNEKMMKWFDTLSFIEKGIFSVCSSNLERDFSCFNNYSFLELKFKLNHGLSTIAPHVNNLDKLTTPISFDWNIIPTETLDYTSTQKIISKMSEYPRIVGMNQTYFFDNENSDLRNCYPIWANIMTHYNFQKIENLNLSVLLSPEIGPKFFCIFGLSVINMYNLRELSLTLHNDGSSEKRFYIQEEIIDMIQTLSKLPQLAKFEFNTEVEILINVLNDFFQALTHFQNLKIFKSEWLQVSTKSFRTFMKKLCQMEHLEILDIHIYSLTEMKEGELKEIFQCLDHSLVKMKNMKRVQITGDSDCFGNPDLWTHSEAQLRKTYPNKIVDLSLAQTE